MKITLLLTLLLSGCVVPDKQETNSFALQITACMQACESRAIKQFDACICRIYPINNTQEEIKK
jgi:hypothetical protein